MSHAWIALGSNLGDSGALLDEALEQIAQLPDSQLLASSARYRTAPIGGPEQPDYLNAACLIDTHLEPTELLQALQQIEQSAGRERHERWGPRTLDLDIIAIDNLLSTDPILTLPHPRAHQRAFVLYPLADLSPRPLIAGHNVQHWLDLVADQAIKRLPD
ncbi:2-amino-4-hydroxy-6-hydroxymethyldihydropteridine diphosphokinase [Saccharospirillum sp. MSK14-1]|uniref:2-amino-4-hydroxy-6- hydroxymethyldihydropteridine diphosphokinase n=1 Tax=Saccharospirillum sp. MSK14-1 TaxID=1897632 RepID=UPI000D35D1B6|nr:2-amino-4-hydroxy-6-hydroxymethyldihydropteridine diphosphokinase [Saccharospirillum sp. MSK14-1]PTY38633.1 2-amino-4-hydroxy-6-hydroxymethyldihydropteridine diphosphokinase [Saccharospirillum sp. MSK14-1]